jgi:hypothetical protein
VSVPELILYRIDGVDQNKEVLDDWAEKRAEAEMKRLRAISVPEGASYVGLLGVSPDGEIRTVLWTINNSGASTEVQKGFEEPRIPTLTYREKLSTITNWRRGDGANKATKKAEREVEDTRWMF